MKNIPAVCGAELQKPIGDTKAVNGASLEFVVQGWRFSPVEQDRQSG
jgi:hypothetical protein